MVVSFSCGHIFASHIYFAHFANMHFLNNINCYLHCKFTLTVHVHWLTKTLCAVQVFLEFQQNPCSVPMIPEETVSQQSSWWCRDAFMNRVVFGCVFKGLLCFVIYILWCLEALLWSNYCFLVLYFQAEGIFRINAENSQEEFVRDQLNSGIVPDGIDVHCLAGLIKVIFFLSWRFCYYNQSIGSIGFLITWPVIIELSMIALTFTRGISCQHLPENTDITFFENFIFSFSCKRYCLNPQAFFSPMHTKLWL